MRPPPREEGRITIDHVDDGFKLVNILTQIPVVWLLLFTAVLNEACVLPEGLTAFGVGMASVDSIFDSVVILLTAEAEVTSYTVGVACDERASYLSTINRQTGNENSDAGVQTCGYLTTVLLEHSLTQNQGT